MHCAAPIQRHGEIDIIEGVNVNTQVVSTLHTDDVRQHGILYLMQTRKRGIAAVYTNWLSPLPPPAPAVALPFSMYTMNE